MTVFDVLRDAPPAQPDKPRPGVKRLLQGDGANLIAFTFSPGQSFADHSSVHPITVTALSGTLTFSYDGETYDLTPGVVIHLDAKVMHRVDCPAESTGDAVMLLTMLTGEKHSTS